MFRLTKHYRNRFRTGHEELKSTYCLMVEHEAPDIPNVQVHEREGVIAYMRRGWVSIRGDHITIRTHDGHGEPIGERTFVLEPDGLVREF